LQTLWVQKIDSIQYRITRNYINSKQSPARKKFENVHSKLRPKENLYFFEPLALVPLLAFFFVVAVAAALDPLAAPRCRFVFAGTPSSLETWENISIN